MDYLGHRVSFDDSIEPTHSESSLTLPHTSYIPVNERDLSNRLLEACSVDNRQLLADLFKRINLLFVLEAAVDEKRMHSDFATHFNRSKAERKAAPLSAAELKAAERRFLSAFGRALHQANFVPLSVPLRRVPVHAQLGD